MGITQIRTALRENKPKATWKPRNTDVSRMAPETAIGALAGAQSDPDLEADALNMTELSNRVQERIEAQAGNDPPPSRFSWLDIAERGGDFIGAPKDQSPGDNSCNSCVSFAVCAAIEARMNIIARQSANDVNLSEAYLFFAGCPNNCCSVGWTIPEALGFCRATGVPVEEAMPYDLHNFDVPADVAPVVKLTRHTKVANNIEAKRLLVKGPILSVLDAFDDLRFYGSGIYQHITGDALGNHAICIVGYDDGDEQMPGHWICKNSWGPDWGESGFFRIAYEDCGIGTHHLFFDFDLELTLSLEEAKAALDKVIVASSSAVVFARALLRYLRERRRRGFKTKSQFNLALVVIDILSVYPGLRADFRRSLAESIRS